MNIDNASLFTRKSPIIVTQNIINAIFGYVGLYFITRYIGIEIWGFIAFGMGFVGIFSLTMELGFSSAYVKSISEGRDIKSVNGTFFAIKFALSVIFVVIIFSALIIWTDILHRGFQNPVEFWVIISLVPYYFLSNMVTVPKSYYSSRISPYRIVLPSIAEAVLRNSIFIVITPFPPDVMAAYYLKRKLKKNVLIEMHHITPSILFHPIRRGPIRSTIAWFISIFALVIVKFDNIPVILDNKRIAKWTGWNINEKLLIEKLSFTDYEIINPRNREGHFAVFVGRIVKNKGIKDLILAWKYVIEKIPDAKLYIIGNDRNNKYHKLILKSKLNNSIIITGFINEYDKKNILRKAQLFVFPSYEEGWGLAVMEAINFGLLPILYDIPAYDYVCDDKIKVKPGNVKEFSKKIIYYFNNPEETIKTISKLQECNKKYTLEYVTQTFLNQIKDRFNI